MPPLSPFLQSALEKEVKLNTLKTGALRRSHPKSFPPIYTLKGDITAMIVRSSNRGIEAVLIQIDPSHGFQQTLLAKRWLHFFCICRSNAWFDNWTYRVKKTLNAQNTKRCANYFSLITKRHVRPSRRIESVMLPPFFDRRLWKGEKLGICSGRFSMHIEIAPRVLSPSSVPSC